MAWENSLSFNIFGERLAFATRALDPDIYEQPRPLLNFTSRKRFGDHYSITFKAENLLNPKYNEAYDYGDKPSYQQYTIGRSFTLEVAYGI